MKAPPLFTIERKGPERLLRIQGPLPEGCRGREVEGGHLCPLNASLAAVVRHTWPWTGPELVGMRTSFGFGDRLGVATPGHLDAARDTRMFPVLAQQSMREMERSRRSPQQVIDDVTWAVVETGYRGGFGSDADHVKTTDEIDRCIEAGFTGFTLDPGAYVQDWAESEPIGWLHAQLATLPWDALGTIPEAHRRFHVSEHGCPPEEYLRSTVKYGLAIAHVDRLQTHLASRFAGAGFDLEISVDETGTATTPVQHRYIALELRRLGIGFIGLAPRFTGHFYKGVDYVGNLEAFDADYAAHAAIARELGPYKLSIHSGSDKLALYPIIHRHTPEHVHVKTSGTSWLEALRVVAAHAPGLFRRILALAVDGYAENRQSYHLDGRADGIPKVSDQALPRLLDHPDARQVLHVAFGAVFQEFHDEVHALLDQCRGAYRDGLRRHFEKHLAPFRV